MELAIGNLSFGGTDEADRFVVEECPLLASSRMAAKGLELP
jgi:hypothetical protein